jgi:hypothetical protein
MYVQKLQDGQYIKEGDVIILWFRNHWVVEKVSGYSGKYRDNFNAVLFVRRLRGNPVRLEVAHQQGPKPPTDDKI